MYVEYLFLSVQEFNAVNLDSFQKYSGLRQNQAYIQ